MVIFGKIKFVGEQIRLYINDTHYYEVYHYFDSFVEDGIYAAAGYQVSENKYYILQVGRKAANDD